MLARASAPSGGGKNPLKVMYALDGASGTLDPSFDAHVLPVKRWALAWWEVWAGPHQLEKASTHRIQMSLAHRAQMARAAGPIATLFHSRERFGNG